MASPMLYAGMRSVLILAKLDVYMALVMSSLSKGDDILWKARLENTQRGQISTILSNLVWPWHQILSCTSNSII